jgi:hypothetical protein
MEEFKEFVPVYVKRIEDCLKKNGDGKGFFVGSSVSTHAQ